MKTDEKTKLAVFFGLVFLALLLSIETKGFATWDDANQGRMTLFAYNLIRNVEGFSLNSIMSYAVDYHSHYKFFSNIIIYPPLHMLFSTFVYLILGASVFSSNFATIVEFLILLVFLYKIAKLYDRNKNYPLVVLLFVALNPIMFNLANKAYLDMLSATMSIVVIYLFLVYMKTKEPANLYLTAITFALALMTRETLVLLAPVCLIVALSEKKLKLFYKDKKLLLKASSLFIIFLSPLILKFAVLYKYNLLGIYTSIWVTGPAVGGSSLASWFKFNLATWKKLLEDLILLFNQWYLLPFFIVGLYHALKRRNYIDKTILLWSFVYLYLLVVKLGNCTSTCTHVRYILPIIPFIILISIKGLYSSIKIRKFLYLLVFIMLSFSALQAINYHNLPHNESQFASYLTNDAQSYRFRQAANIVIDDSREEATVLTTDGAQQMYAFALYDKERKIYTDYLPKRQEDFEKALNNDFSYLKSADLRDKFKVEQVPVKYVIIHEENFKEFYAGGYDNGLSFFLKNDKLRILSVVEGNIPNERTFIFELA